MSAFSKREFVEFGHRDRSAHFAMNWELAGYDAEAGSSAAIFGQAKPEPSPALLNALANNTSLTTIRPTIIWCLADSLVISAVFPAIT